MKRQVQKFLHLTNMVVCAVNPSDADAFLRAAVADLAFGADARAATVAPLVLLLFVLLAPVAFTAFLGSAESETGVGFADVANATRGADMSPAAAVLPAPRLFEPLLAMVFLFPAWAEKLEGATAVVFADPADAACGVDLGTAGVALPASSLFVPLAVAFLFFASPAFAGSTGGAAAVVLADVAGAARDVDLGIAAVALPASSLFLLWSAAASFLLASPACAGSTAGATAVVLADAVGAARDVDLGIAAVALPASSLFLLWLAAASFLL